MDHARQLHACRSGDGGGGAEPRGIDDPPRIIDIILHDEIGHVAAGIRWYRWVCEQRGLDPVSTYAALVQQYDAPRLRGPFNLAARKAAGFTDAELAWLEGGA